MEFLSQKGIQYEDRDITQNPAWFDELVNTGFMATPVTLVNGKAVVGYDTKKLEEVLAA